MSCLKKTIIGFGIFLPVLLSAFFVSPSYAIEDAVFTFTTSTPIQSSNYFPNSVLSNYSYLIISLDSSPNGSWFYPPDFWLYNSSCTSSTGISSFSFRYGTYFIICLCCSCC